MINNIKGTESNEIRSSDLLDSWKEIAAYIQKDVRTCQRWEKLKNLPVHRVGLTKRSRVFALKPEIDRWMESRPSFQLTEQEIKAKRAWVLAGIFASVAITTICVLIQLSPPQLVRPTVHSLNTRAGRVILLDKEKRPLGEYETGLDTLECGTVYHYQSRIFGRTGPNFFSCILLLDDLEGDSRTDVVLVLVANPNHMDNTFILLTDRAEKRWEYTVGESTQSGDEGFLNRLRIRDINAADLDGDGTKEIIVASSRARDCSSQILVLDTEKEKKAECWHDGRIDNISACDFDGDGCCEIIFSGLNTQAGAPCLGILKVGDKPVFQKPPMPFPNMDGLSVESYALFPVIDALRETELCRIRNALSLEATSEGPVIHVRNALHLEIGPKFILNRMKMAPRVTEELRERNRSGTLAKTPRQILEEARAAGLRVWRENVWTLCHNVLPAY
jgi:hypothetical protein